MSARLFRDFLPALQEIGETPPPAAARATVRVLLLFLAAVSTWACLGRVDVVSAARGRIIPAEGVKVVQPLEAGVVRAIFVEEGERVTAGQALIALDGTLPGARRRQLLDRRRSLLIERARLTALIRILSAQETAAPAPGEFFELLPADAAAGEAETARLRLQSAVAQYSARFAALTGERREREARRDAAAARARRLDGIVRLVAERAESARVLAERGMLPRARWLELHREWLEIADERDSQRDLARGMGAAAEAAARRETAARAETEGGIMAELAAVGESLAQVDQEIRVSDHQIRLQTLTAPAPGAVHRLAVHTVGGVVTPAQELMHIVPDGGALEAEAFILNRDIGFVRAGQDAEIKIDAFPFTRYGTLRGRLAAISRDAIPGEGGAPVYRARVILESQSLRVDDTVSALSPGMAVTVEVKLGDRRIIEYLLSPLLRFRDESIRER